MVLLPSLGAPGRVPTVDGESPPETGSSFSTPWIHRVVLRYP